MRRCSMTPTSVFEGEASSSRFSHEHPGCIAAAKTRDEVVKLIQGAVEFHIEALKENGEPVPAPSSSVEFIDVAA